MFTIQDIDAALSQCLAYRPATVGPLAAPPSRGARTHSRSRSRCVGQVQEAAVRAEVRSPRSSSGALLGEHTGTSVCLIQAETLNSTVVVS